MRLFEWLIKTVKMVKKCFIQFSKLVLPPSAFRSWPSFGKKEALWHVKIQCHFDVRNVPFFSTLPNSKSYSRVLGDWHKNAKQGFMDVQISDRQRCLWHFFNIWWCFLKIDQKCLEDFWVQNAIHSFTYLLCLPCLPKFFCHFSHLEIEKLSFWVVEKWKGLYCESDKLIVSAG